MRRNTKKSRITVLLFFFALFAIIVLLTVFNIKSDEVLVVSVNEKAMKTTLPIVDASKKSDNMADTYNDQHITGSPTSNNMILIEDSSYYDITIKNATESINLSNATDDNNGGTEAENDIFEYMTPEPMGYNTVTFKNQTYQMNPTDNNLIDNLTMAKNVSDESNDVIESIQDEGYLQLIISNETLHPISQTSNASSTDGNHSDSVLKEYKHVDISHNGTVFQDTSNVTVKTANSLKYLNKSSGSESLVSIVNREENNTSDLMLQINEKTNEILMSNNSSNETNESKKVADIADDIGQIKVTIDKNETLQLTKVQDAAEQNDTLSNGLPKENTQDVQNMAAVLTSEAKTYFDVLYELKQENPNIKNLNISNEDLFNMCKELPMDNIFMEHDLYQPTKFDNVHRIHFLMLYKGYPTHGSFCGIESLVNALDDVDVINRSIEINLWVTDQTELLDNSQDVLNNLENQTKVKIVTRRFVFEDVISGTPLEHFYNCFSRLDLSLGKYGNQNKANAARLAILYKFGGIYSDLDFVFQRDPTYLDDGVGQESSDKFNTAFLKFSSRQNKLFVLELMNDFVLHYTDLWGKNGPVLLTRVLKKVCNESEGRFKCAVKDSNFTLDIYPPHEIYPIYWRNKDYYTDTSKSVVDSTWQSTKDSTMVHLWNHLIRNKENKACRKGIETYEKTYVGMLRKTYCPLVFEVLKTSCSL